MKPEYRSHFFYSVLFHVIVLTVLIVSFEMHGETPVLENSDKNAEIVNAVVINDSKLETPKPSLLPPPKRETPKKIMPQPEQAKPKPVEVKQEPVKKQEQPTPQKKTIAIPDPRKKQLEIEKQLLADIKQQKEKQKKLKHKDLEKAFEKELKEAAAKSLEQQLLNETKQLSAARAQKMQGVVDKYKALILQAISQNWLVPYNANKNLISELMIRVAPGGLVLDVQVIKSSGDVALDRSARAAVFKASPLPVPTNAEEFELFRQFALKVKPENIAAIS